MKNNLTGSLSCGISHAILSEERLPKKSIKYGIGRKLLGINRFPRFSKLGVIIITYCIQILFSSQASATEQTISFPENYKQGNHYATILRGDIREELYTSPEAIAAARQGGSLPNGTVIMMEDYRNNQLYRYIVMEKKEGGGENRPVELHTGNWEFQWFNQDRSIKRDENLSRCQACHASQSDNDFVFTFNRMKEENAHAN